MIALGRPVVRGTTGAVACGHPLAATAALEQLRAGGTAVDAAVAAAAMLAVVLPDACGLGGDAMALVRAPDGAVHALNGSGAAPARLASPVPPDGAASAAVPGAVDAMVRAHERFGRLELGRLLEPARTLAADGFPVGAGLLAARDAQRARLERGAPGWWLLGDALAPGTRAAQPALARTLGRIASGGRAALYEGEVAEAIVRRVSADGGALAAADLAGHRTIEREPVWSEHGGARIALQPPVSQAMLTALVLRELDPAEGADRTHVAIEAVEAAFARRDDVARPDAEAAVLGPRLELDRERAARRGGPRAYAHTTAVATADADGSVVSMLVSVFDDFGSAALVEEGGFLLNDRLTGFAADPASPNAAAPGRRPVHTLSPALVAATDRAFALATPGADGQVQILAQLLDALLVHGAELPEALAAPRWRSIAGRVAIEAGFDPALADALAARGHVLDGLPAGDGVFGAAVAVGADLAAGTLFAAADPRRETTAAAW